MGAVEDKERPGVQRQDCGNTSGSNPQHAGFDDIMEAADKEEEPAGDGGDAQRALIGMPPSHMKKECW